MRDISMKAFIFPGQGSQRKGMGEKLFGYYRNYTKQADDILGFSIEELCLNDCGKNLNNTRYTQPALFVVNAMAYLQAIENGQPEPDYVAGHSLGEYNALYAAKVFDFETGLKLVKKRGELMAGADNGGMAAIIGMDEKAVAETIERNGNRKLQIANLNTPSQIVISGERSQIEAAKYLFECNSNARYLILNVSGAFHSELMADAGSRYAEYLDQFDFSAPEIPVISNVLARPYPKGDVKKLLSLQMVHSVKWMESICYMWGKGIEEFVEIGPGNVLTGMVKAIKREAKPLRVRLSARIDETDTQENAVETDPIAEKPSISRVGDSFGFKRHTRSDENSRNDLPIESLDKIDATSLGCSEYKRDYNLRYAYAAGAMVHGIASKEMVVRMGNAGMIGYFGTGALPLHKIEDAIEYIQSRLNRRQAYGMNLISGPKENEHVDLYLKYQVPNVEAAAYMQITPALVKYKLNGLDQTTNGSIRISNRIMAKLSRPEVAVGFLSPAPEALVKKLLEQGAVTKEQAALARNLPMADDICVEADSGGHTDMGVASALLPAIIKLRDETVKKYRYTKKIRIGAAGGIGTPEASASAFMLGADFILTGSINQCTVEAGTSDLAKDLLQKTNVQDTAYAPAGDMFEMGSKVQVLRKGVFFPARANRLYELYRHYSSLDELDATTRNQLEKKYFKRSFEDIYEECKRFYSEGEIRLAEKNPKQKMAYVFRWYFNRATKFALEGSEENKVDFQIYCGPALGAFNQWVKGTRLEKWQNRHVDEIAEKLMNETADYLKKRMGDFIKTAR